MLRHRTFHTLPGHVPDHSVRSSVRSLFGATGRLSGVFSCVSAGTGIFGRWWLEERRAVWRFGATYARRVQDGLSMTGTTGSCCLFESWTVCSPRSSSDGGGWSCGPLGGRTWRPGFAQAATSIDCASARTIVGPEQQRPCVTSLALEPVASGVSTAFVRARPRSSLRNAVAVADVEVADLGRGRGVGRAARACLR